VRKRCVTQEVGSRRCLGQANAAWPSLPDDDGINARPSSRQSAGRSIRAPPSARFPLADLAWYNRPSSASICRATPSSTPPPRSPHPSCEIALCRRRERCARPPRPLLSAPLWGLGRFSPLYAQGNYSAWCPLVPSPFGGRGTFRPVPAEVEWDWHVCCRSSVR